jgi:signal transduction histidine kinase
VALDALKKSSEATQRQVLGEAGSVVTKAVSPRPAEAVQVPAEAAQVLPFRPFWLGTELFLVRDVIAGRARTVQGVWLNAAALRASLLDTVADILPHATLEPVQGLAFVANAAGRLLPTAPAPVADPMALVGLPWRLLPNEQPAAVLSGMTPVRFMLVAAWAAAVLAAAAACALLFGVTRLSERRAAFVSSVTHELRTPLTTFRLYSEMLEQGMVSDEAQRTHYLRTLRTEAERLTHLVDNVLAYSRIERANRHTRRERLELAAWLDRVTPRFAERAQESGMSLEVQVLPAARSLVSETDATALEQILFNLIDNACKYAAGRCTEPVVRLILDRQGRWAEWRVCDSGPGIHKRERGRLFRPFHKSADEAANSKPGVGLGLALSKRLARALGGELSLGKGEAAGACLVLRVPGE